MDLSTGMKVKRNLGMETVDEAVAWMLKVAKRKEESFIESHKVSLSCVESCEVFNKKRWRTKVWRFPNTKSFICWPGGAAGVAKSVIDTKKT